jgi:hypothetical protein
VFMVDFRAADGTSHYEDVNRSGCHRGRRSSRRVADAL